MFPCFTSRSFFPSFSQVVLTGGNQSTVSGKPFPLSNSAHFNIFSSMLSRRFASKLESEDRSADGYSLQCREKLLSSFLTHSWQPVRVSMLLLVEENNHTLVCDLKSRNTEQGED